MNQNHTKVLIFEEKNVWHILWQIAPPVMFAQLIQAMYNIVDSYFVGKFSGDGLTALSVLFPVQFFITAVGVGIGVGINTNMSRCHALGEWEKAEKIAGTGTVLAVVSWLVFAVASITLIRPYVKMSVESPVAVEYAVIYGNIVFVGSIGVFLESIWSKVYQSVGNMRRPMAAQIVGTLTNILLDPILIFGWGYIPEMGIAGAAYATVIGQTTAAVVTRSGFRKPPGIRAFFRLILPIFKLGYPTILMNTLVTLYILVLNVILVGFSDAAVTVLGLYYKLQTFFFIPIIALQTCIVPLLSYTFTKREYGRCRQTIRAVLISSLLFMLLGVACFELIPIQLLSLFSQDAEVLAVGESAFRIIGTSFLPAVFSLLMPVVFQAIGAAVSSVLLSLARQIFCLIPLFWGFSLMGLEYTWLAFPLSETIVGVLGIVLYSRQIRRWKLESTFDQYG